MLKGLTKIANGAIESIGVNATNKVLLDCQWNARYTR
jgi:hypothetical protein